MVTLDKLETSPHLFAPGEAQKLAMNLNAEDDEWLYVAEWENERAFVIKVYDRTEPDVMLLGYL